MSGEKTLDLMLAPRKWNWVDHTPRRRECGVTKPALIWTPESHRRQGVLGTHCNHLLLEVKLKGQKWSTLEVIAKDG